MDLINLDLSNDTLSKKGLVKETSLVSGCQLKIFDIIMPFSDAAHSDKSVGEQAVYSKLVEGNTVAYYNSYTVVRTHIQKDLFFRNAIVVTGIIASFLLLVSFAFDLYLITLRSMVARSVIRAYVIVTPITNCIAVIIIIIGYKIFTDSLAESKLLPSYKRNLQSDMLTIALIIIGLIIYLAIWTTTYTHMGDGEYDDDITISDINDMLDDDDFSFVPYGNPNAYELSHIGNAHDDDDNTHNKYLLEIVNDDDDSNNTSFVFIALSDDEDDMDYKDKVSLPYAIANDIVITEESLVAYTSFSSFVATHFVFLFVTAGILWGYCQCSLRPEVINSRVGTSQCDDTDMTYDTNDMYTGSTQRGKTSTYLYTVQSR